MRFDPDQLETLLCIAEEGSFDAAARRLHLTPSAVSQRVRALEAAVGRVLVRRSAPSEVTTEAAALLRLARQWRLAVAEASVVVAAEAAALELAVAVNADSLATWLLPVFDAVAGRPGTVLRLAVEDQAYSQEMLRRGEALAAVTSEPVPVQGCASEPLGLLRYMPAATPSFVARHRRGRGLDWAEAPMVVFNEKDHLQDQVLAAHGAERPAVVHRVPNSEAFHEAVRRGLGWGAVAEAQLLPDLASGRLIRLPGGRPVDVALHWQRWRLDSPALEALTADVRAAARAGLRRGRAGAGHP